GGFVRYDGGGPLGGRLTVGHQTLDLRVQVRILAPQPSPHWNPGLGLSPPGTPYQSGTNRKQRLPPCGGSKPEWNQPQAEVAPSGGSLPEWDQPQAEVAV